MGPSQLLMEFEADQISQNRTSNSDIKNSLENPATKSLSCSNNVKNNCEDIASGTTKEPVDTGNKSPSEADSGVNVIDCGNSSDVKFAETEDPNATEYSSSFDGTTDDGENFAGLSDGEVESQLFGDDNGFGSAFDAFDRVFPTKYLLFLLTCHC